MVSAWCVGFFQSRMVFARFSLLIAVVYYAVVFNSEVNGSDQFFIKSASPKKIPLIGKRSKNVGNMDFEKFFLKASKSVPRIGRTGAALQQVKYSFISTAR